MSQRQTSEAKRREGVRTRERFGFDAHLRVCELYCWQTTLRGTASALGARGNVAESHRHAHVLCAVVKRVRSPRCKGTIRRNILVVDRR